MLEWVVRWVLWESGRGESRDSPLRAPGQGRLSPSAHQAAAVYDSHPLGNKSPGRFGSSPLSLHQPTPARLPSSAPLALPVYRPEECAHLGETRACRYQNKRRAAQVLSQSLPCDVLCHRRRVLETAEKHLESPRSAPSHQLSLVTEMPYHLPSPHGSLKGLRTGTGDTAASGVMTR